MELHEHVERVASREDFVALVQRLGDDHRFRRHEWENRDLAAFLDAMAAWAADMDAWFAARGEQAPDGPSWNLLASMLVAAKSYD